MKIEYVQVKVYAVKDEERLVEMPDGAVGIIDSSGQWVHGPLPIQWSKVMLKNTLTEWTRAAWTRWGIEFVEGKAA